MPDLPTCDIRIDLPEDLEEVKTSESQLEKETGSPIDIEEIRRNMRKMIKERADQNDCGQNFSHESPYDR